MARWIKQHPYYIVVWLLALAAGATIAALARNAPVAVGLAYTTTLAAYLALTKRTHRSPLVFLLAGIQYTALARAASDKIILPFIIIEKGPIGTSAYPDLAQIIAAYEILTTLHQCGKQYNPPQNETPPTVPR